METKRLIQFTCPECRGPMTEENMDGILEYRCLVGHAYSPRCVLQAHGETQERTLWAAVVALEEGANIARILAPQFDPVVAERLEKQALQKLGQAAEVRKLLEGLEPFLLD